MLCSLARTAVQRPDPAAGRAAYEALVHMLAARDRALGEHALTVAELARAVGRRLHIDRGELDGLLLAAGLHDIGKIVIPSVVLERPGPLTEAEWRLIRRHTRIGERIVSAVPDLRPLARVVGASHEAFDGSGYPDGLAGDDIPLGARVILVCDAFDAMISDRPYRPALSFDAALKELELCAAGQFDPRVVDAFLQVVSGAWGMSPSLGTAMAA